MNDNVESLLVGFDECLSVKFDVELFFVGGQVEAHVLETDDHHLDLLGVGNCDG